MNFYTVTLPQNIPNGRWISENPEAAKKMCQPGAKIGVGQLPTTEYVSEFYHPLGWDLVPDMSLKAGENSLSVFESDLGGYKYQSVETLNGGDAQRKIVYKKRGYGVQHELVQTQHANGAFEVKRYHGKGIQGYEYQPLQRKLAKSGMVAKLERLAFLIGSDANGCERPMLRTFAGRIFEMSRRFL